MAPEGSRQSQRGGGEGVGGNERVSEELSATPLQTGFSLCGSFIKNVALPFQIFKAS